MARRFQLDSVLHYRTSLEDQAQQALALSLQKQRDLLTAIDEQQNELQEQDRQLKALQHKGLAIAEIDLYERRIDHCRRRCAQLKAELQQLEQKICQERDTLLQAARDRQVLDKLKDRQETEFRLEQERQERLQLDEISLRNKRNMP
ncbi:MAG: flagellar export protein FliJ [Pelovirga sp.]